MSWEDIRPKRSAWVVWRWRDPVFSPLIRDKSYLVYGEGEEMVWAAIQCHDARKFSTEEDAVAAALVNEGFVLRLR